VQALRGQVQAARRLRDARRSARAHRRTVLLHGALGALIRHWAVSRALRVFDAHRRKQSLSAALGGWRAVAVRSGARRRAGAAVAAAALHRRLRSCFTAVRDHAQKRAAARRAFMGRALGGWRGLCAWRAVKARAAAARCCWLLRASLLAWRYLACDPARGVELREGLAQGLAVRALRAWRRLARRQREVAAAVVAARAARASRAAAAAAGKPPVWRHAGPSAADVAAAAATTMGTPAAPVRPPRADHGAAVVASTPQRVAAAAGAVPASRFDASAARRPPGSAADGAAGRAADAHFSARLQRRALTAWIQAAAAGLAAMLLQNELKRAALGELATAQWGRRRADAHFALAVCGRAVAGWRQLAAGGRLLALGFWAHTAKRRCLRALLRNALVGALMRERSGATAAAADAGLSPPWAYEAVDAHEAAAFELWCHEQEGGGGSESGSAGGGYEQDEAFSDAARPFHGRATALAPPATSSYGSAAGSSGSSGPAPSFSFGAPPRRPRPQQPQQPQLRARTPAPYVGGGGTPTSARVAPASSDGSSQHSLSFAFGGGAGGPALAGPATGAFRSPQAPPWQRRRSGSDSGSGEAGGTRWRAGEGAASRQAAAVRSGRAARSASLDSSDAPSASGEAEASFGGAWLSERPRLPPQGYATQHRAQQHRASQAQAFEACEGGSGDLGGPEASLGHYAAPRASAGGRSGASAGGRAGAAGSGGFGSVGAPDGLPDAITDLWSSGRPPAAGRRSPPREPPLAVNPYRPLGSLRRSAYGAVIVPPTGPSSERREADRRTPAPGAGRRSDPTTPSSRAVSRAPGLLGVLERDLADFDAAYYHI